MHRRNAIRALWIVAAVAAVTADVAAQGISINLGRQGRHHNVGIGIGIPLGGGRHVHHDGCRSYVPGHYDIVHEQIWVGGGRRQVWVEAVSRTRYDHHGRPYHEVVTPGHYQWVEEPRQLQWVERKVWVPDTWAYVCGHR